MKTLEDAWRWYHDLRQTLQRMERIGWRYWDAIAWDQLPWSSDNKLRDLKKEQVIDSAQNGLQSLDDLAIVVLFSVFEALVRGTILEESMHEAESVRHRVLRNAVVTALDQVSEGSFYRLLQSYKGIDDALVEQVNQVRSYRNWVAHGKSGTEPPFVSPTMAYDRLNRFLARFFPSAT